MVVHYGYIIAPPPPGDHAITVTNKNRAFNYTINLAVEAPQIIEPTGDRNTPAERSARRHRTTIDDLSQARHHEWRPT